MSFSLPFDQKKHYESLFDLICEHFHFEPIKISRLRGFSNQNYSISDATGRLYVLRIARVNRTKESLHAEEYVLKLLEKNGFAYTPKLTHSSIDRLKINFQGLQHYIYLFDPIQGEMDCFWWQQCSISKLKELFGTLALLHIEMARIPILEGINPASYKYQLPSQAPSIISETDTGCYVLKNWDQFYQQASYLQDAMARHFPWKEACYQWIHGDIQLENVLFDSNHLSAILDFEYINWDACEKDVILSAFRVCKEGNTDAPFQYDEARFKIAIETYLQNNKTLCAEFFIHYDKLWKPFFCLDQAMIYLMNAFDGVWKLDKEIGFLPCFNEVLNYQPKPLND